MAQNSVCCFVILHYGFFRYYASRELLTFLAPSCYTEKNAFMGVTMATKEEKNAFREAGFGIMIHWGLYALLGGEYKGEVMSYIGEWAQSYFRIPNAEYQRLASAFHPIYFDADEWVRVLKRSGAKYLVVTAKHHDGFALFHSKASSYNIVDATPFGRDVIRELSDACRRHGIKLGLYYSQAIDWSHPDGLNYRGCKNADMMSWGNDWDFPNEKEKHYERCFCEKIKPDVEQLLTEYGDLFLIWFDTPAGLEEKYSRELYTLVKHHQPHCLVNSRLGNGYHDYVSAGDNEIPEDDKGELLFESPVTLNHTWGYKPSDQDWKNPDELRALHAHLRARGINFLLNIGPDPLGRFPARAVEILTKLGSEK